MSNVTARQILLKQPAESRVFSMDFAELLASGETISTGQAAASSDSGDGQLTVGSPTISGTKLLARISGGTANQRYRLEWTATTSDSNTLEQDSWLDVKDS